MSRKMAGLLMVCAMASGGAERILVHGHRGAREMRPENTLPAFEYAIEAGVDVLELDVAVTKDNVLVVSHHPTLARPICSEPRTMRSFTSSTLEQVRVQLRGA